MLYFLAALKAWTEKYMYLVFSYTRVHKQQEIQDPNWKINVFWAMSFEQVAIQVA